MTGPLGGLPLPAAREESADGVHRITIDRDGSPRRRRRRARGPTPRHRRRRGRVQAASGRRLVADHGPGRRGNPLPTKPSPRARTRLQNRRESRQRCRRHGRHAALRPSIAVASQVGPRSLAGTLPSGTGGGGREIRGPARRRRRGAGRTLQRRAHRCWLGAPRQGVDTRGREARRHPLCLRPTRRLGAGPGERQGGPRLDPLPRCAAPPLSGTAIGPRPVSTRPHRSDSRHRPQRRAVRRRRQACEGIVGSRRDRGFPGPALSNRVDRTGPGERRRVRAAVHRPPGAAEFRPNSRAWR